MANVLFRNETEISDQWVNYIASEVEKVADFKDLEIENYADQEIMNPEMQEYLEGFTDNEKLSIEELEGRGEFLNLSSSQATMFNAASVAGIFGLRFRKLKRTIRKVFCEVIAPMIDNDGQINIKDIIKAVLVGLIPVLAGTGGVAAVLLPVIVAIVAKFVKRGVDAVCPV
jgi:hypothetical protein